MSNLDRKRQTSLWRGSGKPSADHKGGTLRLVMPEWQGGNEPAYTLGARILELIAPPAQGPVEEVPIGFDTEGLPEDRYRERDYATCGSYGLERGIFARSAVFQQQRAADDILRRRMPDKVFVIGGPCNVSVAPFAYLNERYEGDLALLWMDAHPDLSDPEVWSNYHAMALATLVGLGDEEFAREIARPLAISQVLHVAVRAPITWPPNGVSFPPEDPRSTNYGVSLVSAEAANRGSAEILQWLGRTGVTQVAVHLDLDSLDPSEFGALMGPEPGGLRMESVVRLLGDVAESYEIVGLGIAEFLPKEIEALANMMSRLPLVGET